MEKAFIYLLIVGKIGTIAELQNTPSLEFEPKPTTYNDGVTLIRYESTNKNSSKIWVDRLETVLAEYRKNENFGNVVSCSPNEKPPKGKVCDFSVNNVLGTCTKDNLFGFYRRSPCVLISINKTENWVPEYYNTSTIPTLMPSYLKDKIRQAEGKKEQEKIWVTCQGEGPVDDENIGPIEYYPDMGLSSEYFPYEKIDGYMNPLVAVHFRRPIAGIIINIICKAWADNIEHDQANQKGSVHFELLIE